MRKTYFKPFSIVKWTLNQNIVYFNENDYQNHIWKYAFKEHGSILVYSNLHMQIGKHLVFENTNDIIIVIKVYETISPLEC